MKTALIFPPTCDPTAPYMSIPTLTGYLRAHGVEVLPIDANVEAYEWLLRKTPLDEMAQRIKKRLRHLEGKSQLNHTQQLVYVTLWKGRGDGSAAPSGIENAVAILRNREANEFFDAHLYKSAVATVESALQLISAAFNPLAIDFTTYRTPFSLLTMEEIKKRCAAKPESVSCIFFWGFEHALG